MITRVFNLGKKPYSYKIDENSFAVLIGKSEWNEGLWCKLSLILVVTNDNQTPIEELAQTGSVLGEYVNRSLKFNSGNFEDFDAQRYIKSRYREIIRHANRQQSGFDAYNVLRRYSINNN